MRKLFIPALGVLAAAARLQALQSMPPQPSSPPATPPAAAQAQAGPSVQEIYRIDLNPTASTFSVGAPKLEGDVYVFNSFPERTMTRVPKANVKKVTQVTKDLNKETVYQIDLVPSGTTLTTDEPKLKSGAYVFHTLKNGTLMSLRKADVKKISLLTGFPAFKAKQQALGTEVLVGNPPMAGGTVHVIPAPGAKDAQPAQAPSGQSPGPSNWIYEGVPGKTDAFAPGNNTIASPGDVPRAPEPPPPPPPPPPQ